MSTVSDTSLDLIAAVASDAHKRAEEASSAALRYMHTAGEQLSSAKARVPHGLWIDWLEANFEGSVRRAQMYIRLFENWNEIQAKNATVSHLTLRAALESIGTERPSEDMEGLYWSVEAIAKDVVRQVAASGQSMKSIRHKADAIAELVITGAVNTVSGEMRPATDLIAVDVLERERQATIRQREHVNEKLERTLLPIAQLNDLKELARHADLEAQSRYTKRWGDLL